MSSQYADEGSIAHALAAMCLNEGKPASAYIGRLIVCDDYEHASLSPSSAHRWMRCPGSHALETRIAFKPRRFSAQVTDDMARDVQVYLDNLARYTTNRGADFMVEQRLTVGHITGEAGATGSGDCVVMDNAAYELQVHDLKFGRGVEVSAEENEQLALYLLGALEDFGEFAPEGGWRTFRGVIHQPRIRSEPDEWVWTREQLEEFAKECSAKARDASACKQMGDDYDMRGLAPGDKQCKFCDAKATCPALTKKVAKAVLADVADFSDLDAGTAPLVPIPQNAEELGKMLALVPMIDAWCSALTAHAEAELLAGRPVPGYKLVQGKRGNRAWRDKAEAEAALKAMRIKHDEMYDYSVISPTTAEKRLAKEHPRQWTKLQELITQSDGKPTVVPAGDKRPALEVKPVLEEFTALDAPAEELV